jgi:hypothetical protein
MPPKRNRNVISTNDHNTFKKHTLTPSNGFLNLPLQVVNDDDISDEESMGTENIQEKMKIPPITVLKRDSKYVHELIKSQMNNFDFVQHTAHYIPSNE